FLLLSAWRILLGDQYAAAQARYNIATALTMTAQQFTQLALQHHHAGRLAEAEGLYRKALALDPNYLDAMAMYGALAAGAGRFDHAAQLFSRAVAVRADVGEYHLHLGHARLGLKDYQAAVDSCRRCIALKPKLPAAWNTLGLALRELGKSEEAAGAFR